VNALPLAGRRVLVTRAAHQAGKLSEGLRALGAEPVELPVIQIHPPTTYDPLDIALRQLDHYDWLILTSANAVRTLSERADFLGFSLKTLAPSQVAAIGEATAAAARQSGFQIAFVPEAYVAESLVEGLLHSLENQASAQRILLVRAAQARDVIPDALRAAGAEVDVVEAYRNVLPAAAPEQLRRALQEGLDAATFTSSSSVTNLAAAARAAGLAWPFANLPAISIGPITSQTLRDLGWPPAAEANPSDISGLISTLVQWMSR
jgi:uroporphyrinogen-III synthase/uroporphyrinogen III methyltransferase/synthase